jgi:hypothetical protein
MEKKRFIIGMLVTIMVCSVAQAVPLTPGGNVALSGTTSAANPSLAGVVQEDPITPFNNGTEFSGDLQGRVVLSNILETMIFAPRVRNISDLVGSGWGLIGIEIKGFAGWSTDVDYRTDGLGDKGPGSASRSVDGDVLVFDFSADSVGDANDTYFLSVLTDAPAYVPVEDGIKLTFITPVGDQVTITLPYFMPAAEVNIDIKPGSCPNPFNAKSKGSVPVAIVGSENFDVTTVDPTTITLNGVPIVPENVLMADVTEPGGDNTDCFTCFEEPDPITLPDGTVVEYSGDGYLDMVVKFDTQALAAAIGSVPRDTCVVLTLNGLTNDGIAISGSDSVLTRKK